MSENIDADILVYTTLELESLKRELTDAEKKQQEEIVTRTGLTREQIIEKGKERILS